MQGSIFRNVILGFIAAAIAVVTTHEAILYAAVNYLGLLPAAVRAWNTTSFGPLGVPLIVNSMFWGGLWGALFGLVYNLLPGGASWLKGLIFGLFIPLISNWTLLPLIRGKVFGVTNPAQTAFFSGGDPKRMLAVLLILGGFGLALGILYGLLNKKA